MQNSQDYQQSHSIFLQQISALNKDPQKQTTLPSPKLSWASLLPLQIYVLWINKMVFILVKCCFHDKQTKNECFSECLFIPSFYFSAGIPKASALCNITTRTFDVPNILNCDLTLEKVFTMVSNQCLYTILNQIKLRKYKLKPVCFCFFFY